MSQDYRFRYDELLDNDPGSPQDKETGNGQGNGEHYASHSNVRNLAFVWEDGRRLFLNYSYLVSGEYLPSERLIRLAFTTHEVAIKGIFLDSLFEELMGQSARIIARQDARYNATADKNQPRVNTIDVTKLV